MGYQSHSIWVEALESLAEHFFTSPNQTTPVEPWLKEMRKHAKKTNPSFYEFENDANQIFYRWLPKWPNY